MKDSDKLRAELCAELEARRAKLADLTALCDKGMNDGTPWWVFRDAVRDILEKD